MIVGDIGRLITDNDVTVQKGALEAVMTITHNQHTTVSGDLISLVQAAMK